MNGCIVMGNGQFLLCCVFNHSRSTVILSLLANLKGEAKGK